MNTKTVTLTRQDWAFFGLHWLILIGISAGLYLQRTQIMGTAADISDILIALVVGALVNVIFFLLAMFPNLQKVIPAVIILGDWVIAGFFFNLAAGDPILIIATASMLMLTGALRLGLVGGIIEAAGIVAVLIGIVEIAPSDVTLSDLSLPLLIVALIGIVANVAGYLLEHMNNTYHREIELARISSSIEIEDMREKTRAITEMATALGSTLNYEKVLNAAIEAGRLGMRDHAGKRLTSAILIFRESGELEVATGRGLTRNDEGRVVPGKEGIIGRALREGTPILGKEARKDPELQYFVAFQAVRSILCIPLRARYDNFGVLLYGSDVADAFTEDHMDLLAAIGTQVTIALQNAVLYRNLVQEKERIVDVEEDARKKLARDLHDGPTQNVSAIAMRMSYIYRLLERKPEDVPAELKKVEELARKTTKEIRNMLFTLRPLVLESQGLTAALNQLSEKLQETHNQAVAINVGGDVERVLDSHQQGVIFYIVEEAVGNARKHAEAELISVNVHRQEDVVVVQIADNGVGFDTGAVDANYDQRGSLGMVNMRERAALLDASLRIESAEGKGTTITILVPIKSTSSITQTRNPKVGKIGATIRPGESM
jgi:signal transduction histidine kinase